jgi:hypothetical protein
MQGCDYNGVGSGAAYSATSTYQTYFVMVWALLISVHLLPRREIGFLNEVTARDGKVRVVNHNLLTNRCHGRRKSSPMAMIVYLRMAQKLMPNI